jgi:hypothetical protein
VIISPTTHKVVGDFLILTIERMGFIMSNFSKFMKANKIQKQNVMHPVTKSLTDDKGEPLLWEIKPLTTKENEYIRESCTIEVPVKGKPNQYRPKVDMNKYQTKLICAAIVSPDLNDAELQDSYGVMSAEELIKEMVDDPAEYTELMIFIQQLSGFKTLQEEVDEAKN